jgi:hypothetical protein
MSNSRPDPFKIQLKNDLLGLALINRWGWMRPAELGTYLWPKSKDSGRKQACAQCAKWLSRGLVLQRKLPQRAGYCYVLAKAGVDFLRENGKEAVSGKDIGRGSGEDWLPPADWKHHLLTIGALSLTDALHDKDKALSDLAIRRMNLALYKFPDAVCFFEWDDEWLTLFVETENARKTKGKDLTKMITAFQHVAKGVLHIGSFTPNAVGIVYDKENKINHRLRMTNLLKSKMQIPVLVIWMDCTTKMYGVIEVEYFRELIEPDIVQAYIQEINKKGWEKTDNGKEAGELQNRKLIRWVHTDGTIRIKIAEEKCDYAARNRDEATKRIAERYVERLQEFERYGQITEGDEPIPEPDYD